MAIPHARPSLWTWLLLSPLLAAAAAQRCALRLTEPCPACTGIVYDTGGLALKPKLGMGGMKADCGGAAGLLGAFQAAVAIGTGGTALHLLLCLAENAIGPAALRNDDVVRCASSLRTAWCWSTPAGAHLLEHIPR